MELKAQEAIWEGHVELLRSYLKDGLPVDSYTESGKTLLMEAAQYDHVECFLLLLAHNARIFARDKTEEKWTALHYAAKYGSKDCLSVLATLANTIQDLNDQTFVTGLTALILAAQSSSAESVCILLEHGASMQLKDASGKTALQTARNHKIDVLEALTDPSILQWNYAEMDDAAFMDKLNQLDPDYKCSVLLINHNQLTSLPDLTQYPQFSQLKVLNANYNQIKTVSKDHIPDSVEKLYLFNNKLKSIPDSLLRYTAPSAIKHGLFCIKNLLMTDLPNLNEVDGLQNIKYIYMPNQNLNTIHGLPVSTEFIKMTNNLITVLSSACFLSESLYNVLSKALTHWQVSTLRQPPPEVFRRGYKAVKLYYKDVELTQTLLNSKNRLAVIGESTAGKTSLILSLMKQSPRLTRIEDRTQVVDIKSWSITANDIYLIFDQGGNIIYSITNPLFISKECTVLLVHDLSRSDEGNVSKTMHAYKRTLQQHPDIPIHFVLTHIDLIDVESDPFLNTIESSSEKFKSSFMQLLEDEIATVSRMKMAARVRDRTININLLLFLEDAYERKLTSTRFFPVSSATYQGIPELHKFLITSIMRKRVVLPKKWINCFKLMIGQEANFLTFSDFNRIYESTSSPMGKLICKFRKIGSSYENPSTVNCLQYFSDTGLVLWYFENKALQNVVFHNLEFLINIFKAVFHHDLIGSLNYEDNKPLQVLFDEVEYRQVISQYQHQGLLSFKLLVHLWDKYDLDAADQEALIELMKKFNLCHELWDEATLCNKGKENQLYFYPWFVKENTPPSSIDSGKLLVKENLLNFHLECLFHNSIPMNICEMFIVRLQRFAVEHNYMGKRWAWSNGLHVVVGNMDCCVVRDIENMALRFCSSGEVDSVVDMWEALSEMKDSLKSILGQWHGVVKSLHVVCPHCVMKGVDCKCQKLILDQVFPEDPEKTPRFVSCGEDSIPCGLITRITKDADCKQHVSDIREYLTNFSKGESESEDNEGRKAADSIYDQLLQKHYQLLVDHLDIDIIDQLYSEQIISLKTLQQTTQRHTHQGTIVALEFLIQALHGVLHKGNFAAFLECVNRVNKPDIVITLQESLSLIQSQRKVSPDKDSSLFSSEEKVEDNDVIDSVAGD